MLIHVLSNVIILLCATVGTAQVNMTNGVELTPIITIMISASIGGIMVIVVLFLMVATVIYFTLVKGILYLILKKLNVMLYC